MPKIELVSREGLTSAKWWSKLTAAEQRTVLLETQAYTEQLVVWGMARLGMGEHLANLRAILKPKRIWVQFLRKQFNTSEPSAYRYIKHYLDTKDRVPESVLRTAIANGYDVLNLDLVEKMPPPKTEDRAKIVQYLEKVRMASKEEKSSRVTEYDYDTLMKEALNFVEVRRNRVEEKWQSKWINEFVGMVLSRSGMKARRFTPVEVPEGFEVVRGRPRTSAA